jgi:hypothetical protein
MGRLGFLSVLALGLALSASLAACDKPADPNGPAPVVEKLYAPYTGPNGNTASALANAPLSADLKALIDKADAYSKLLDEPVIDFDPIIFAQDGKITNVRVVQQNLATANKDKGEARAHFSNSGENKEVAYDMSRVNGVWQIDNIRQGDEDLRGIIAAALKPAGDPNAMIAPVKAIYDTYAEPSKPAEVAEPLTSYAVLAASLRPLLEQREAETKRDRDPLGFDPIVGANAWKLSNVTFEAVSGSVIARFVNGTGEKTIVFDMVEENGAWAVENIRDPGVWDLRLNLNNAGIK